MRLKCPNGLFFKIGLYTVLLEFSYGRKRINGASREPRHGLCNKLGLKPSSDVIENALPFLEIWHILVHADGKINKEFSGKYPMFKKDSKGRINLNYDLIMEATEKVTSLIAC